MRTAAHPIGAHSERVLAAGGTPQPWLAPVAVGLVGAVIGSAVVWGVLSALTRLG